MTRVQSPEIGSALRTALSLDAAGGMPLTFDETITPVAIVADVRELLTQKFIAVHQGGIVSSVVGEYSYTMLEWVANSIPRPRRIILDAITLSSSAAGLLYFGFSSSGVAGGLFGLPRRKVGSLQSSAVAGRVVGGTSVTPTATIIENYVGAYSIPADTPTDINFREPIILDREGQYFGIGMSATAVNLRAHFQWREERP